VAGLEPLFFFLPCSSAAFVLLLTADGPGCLRGSPPIAIRPGHALQRQWVVPLRGLGLKGPPISLPRTGLPAVR
jgi:hypothetical protein